MNALSALVRALPAVFSPAILRVLLKTVATTLLVFAALSAILYVSLEAFFAQAGLFAGFSQTLLVSLLITIMAMWILFRVVALAVLQFFADEIVIAVEKAHFPATSAGTRALPFKQDVRNSLRGAGRAILVNVVAAPFALLLIFTAIGPAILFWFVNAVLLGRELTDMPWLRHCADGAADCPIGPSDRFILGGAVAAMMMVPFVNILAPVLGAAGATFLVNSRLENDQNG